jgi:hypothetical protein
MNGRHTMPAKGGTMDMNSEAIEQAGLPSRPAASKHTWIVVGIALVALLVAVAGVVTLRGNENAAGEGVTSGLTQSVDGGGVTVKATWNGDRSAPAFTVALDTHTVDLDGYDLSDLAALRVNGTEIAPVTWGAPKGGHHREGELTFPVTMPDGTPVISADTIELVLVVRGVGGMEERVLRWSL